MCKRYKNKDQNTKLQELTPNAGGKHQMYKKGPKRIKLNFQSLQLNPKCTKDILAREKNTQRRYFWSYIMS